MLRRCLPSAQLHRAPPGAHLLLSKELSWDCADGGIQAGSWPVMSSLVIFCLFTPPRWPYLLLQALQMHTGHSFLHQQCTKVEDHLWKGNCNGRVSTHQWWRKCFLVELICKCTGGWALPRSTTSSSLLTSKVVVEEWCLLFPMA